MPSAFQWGSERWQSGGAAKMGIITTKIGGEDRLVQVRTMGEEAF